MFDIFPKLLSSVASFLFPLFASYKALKTSDPAELTPWLMYWVVLACALLVESWTEWILFWIPFYSYIRLFFLLYLVLPQTQGARVIYQTHLHPYLQQNEAAIDDFIASAHDRMRAAGLAYLKRAIELFKTRVLGMPPEPEQPPPPSSYYAAGQSYTQSLLARFSVPAARWSAASAPGGSNTAAADFYSLLAGAVSATLGGGAASAGGAVSRAVQPASASGLIPSHVGEADKASFIATQRERLKTLLAALDREAAQLGTATAARDAGGSLHMDGAGSSRGGSLADHTPPATAANPWDSNGGGEASSSSRPSSGLSKSRSEHDFEKIEAESAGDDDASSVRRRNPPSAGGGVAAGGSWLPWGWGGPGTGGGDDHGRSSGVEQ